MAESREEARQRLEEIRSQVRKAPDPDLPEAPDWLYGIEEMRDFFSSSAPVWDSVFGTTQEAPLYQAVGAQIAPDLSPEIHILVLGCGTGLELEVLFSKTPNAQVTGIDLAPGMLVELRRKFKAREDQIGLIEASYVGLPLGKICYDYILAVLTLHHLPPKTKLELYLNVRQALKPEGRFILGDQSTSPEMEAEFLRWHHAYVAGLPDGNRGLWNYDVTLSPETEGSLLRDAGFQQITLTWEARDEAGHGLAVFAAQK